MIGDWRDDLPPNGALVWRREGDKEPEPVETTAGYDGKLSYLIIGYEADIPWLSVPSCGPVLWLPLPAPFPPEVPHA